MTPSKHQAGFIPPFENMPRGEYLVIWRKTALSLCLLGELFDPWGGDQVQQ